MATIHGPRMRENSNEPDGVKSVTEVKTYAFTRVVDGQKVMGLAIVFGKMPKDGGPGVFVLAEGEQMNEQLKVASEQLTAAIRQKHAEATGSAAVMAAPSVSDFDPEE